MRGNTIHMRLAQGVVSKTGPLFQYDYGQILVLEGTELPETYEVHFSNSGLEESKTSLGTSDGVLIPDEFLTTGKPVYVYVFLHNTEDDGETEYIGIIDVIRRSKPSETEPTPVQQDIITQAIAALNAAVTDTEENVAHYPKIMDGYWYVWDAENNDWANTGVAAQGPRGETGATGLTPNMTIGTVETGAAGSSAEATITGTQENPVLNLKIPKGDPGELTQADVSSVAETQEIIDEYEG